MSENGDDVVPDDQALAAELLAGWPAGESTFEVRDVECVKLADRVQVTKTVVNKNDFAWAFGVETVFITSDGERISQRDDPGFWDPGEAIELSWWMGGPEDFDDPPHCEIRIYHGTPLAFRPPERRAETYERLGWDPTEERRTDEP